MARYIARRLVGMVLLLIAVSGITFLIFNLLPTTDPAVLRAGRQPTPELIEQIRQDLGLDRPWPVQFVDYIYNVFFHLDFGRSYQTNQDVLPLILDDLPATISLALGAVVIWLTIGLTVGVISAVKRGTLLDRTAMSLSLVAISATPYWLGLVTLYLFAPDFGVLGLPFVGGQGSYVPLTENPIDWAKSLILPWFVLATSFAAVYARLLRGSLLEVLGQDYIRTARAKGLKERTVIMRHGVRSAITPVITVLGLDIGILLGGAILTESVFNIQGIGRLAYDAITRSDLPIVQGTVLFGAFFIVIMNLIVDIAYAFLDPRVRYEPAPLLELRDLEVRFITDDGVVQAVGGVSYSVEAGRSLGIVGESGSGKSVSSQTILGLTRAPNTHFSGQILFEGRDLLTMSESELRQIRGEDIAMIFQDPLSSLHPFHRIGDQLVEAVRTHHDVSKQAAGERAIEMLTLVGIPEPRQRMRSYPHEFSGGMRQRTMIAMALVNSPKLLIADEPTTALDVTVQAQILELISRLQEETGTAVILITHDLGVVAEMTHDIAVMYAGRIVERAPTAQLFASPQHPYTWGLLRSIPRLDASRDEQLVPIEGRPPSLINLPSGCSFHPRCAFVRPAHKRVEPELEPVDGDPGHEVACLLAAQTRRELWRRLAAGEAPEQARSTVPMEDARA